MPSLAVLSSFVYHVVSLRFLRARFGTFRRYLRFVRSRHVLRIGVLLWLLHYLFRQGKRARLVLHSQLRSLLSSSSSSSSSSGLSLTSTLSSSSSTRALLMASMIANCASLHTRYWPFILNIGLLQTIIDDKLSPRAYLVSLLYPSVQLETVELPTDDGGRVLLQFSVDAPGTRADCPVIMIFPGHLGGSSSSYVVTLKRLAVARGYRVVVYVRRGCGENRLAHARLPQNFADEEDIELALERIVATYPDAPLLAVGYSLGGNFLVRHLGLLPKQGRRSPIECAVSLGAPYNLVELSYYFKYGNTLVSNALASAEKERVMEHRDALQQEGIDVECLLNSATYRELVHNFQWHLYEGKGEYKHMDEYLRDSSSCHYVRYVDVPLLCVHALDDPVCPQGLIPYGEFRSNPMTVLAETSSGGHHAYLSMNMNPFSPKWSEELVMDWFSQYLERRDAFAQRS